MVRGISVWKYLVADSEDEGYFTVTKMDREGLIHDRYTVSLREHKKVSDLQDEDVACSCPGFRVQKYSKRLHKHVRLVIAHIQREGRPEESEYLLDEENSPILLEPMEQRTRGTL